MTSRASTRPYLLLPPLAWLMDNAGEMQEAIDDLEAADAAPPDPRHTFTATGTYSYVHDLGAEPDVTVLDSSGEVIEVCVRHLDLLAVSLSFVGTLTAASLILTI